MSGMFVAHSFNRCNETELKKLVDLEIKQAQYESGNYYSGDWGEKCHLLIKAEVFTDSDDASEYVSDNSNKHDNNLIAVKVIKKNAKRANVFNIDAKINAFKSKIDGLCVNELVETIVERVRTSKSNLRACTDCGSKISTRHIRYHNCPVCSNHAFLITKTDKKKIERHKTMIADYKSSITQLEYKKKMLVQKVINTNSNNSNWYWYVGAWCRD